MSRSFYINAVAFLLCGWVALCAVARTSGYGGRTEPDKSRAFSFRHMETTGITDYIQMNGKEIAIQFSPRSNRAALDAFESLQPYILLANADGRRIWVVGTLEPAVNLTPSGPNMAQSEPYHEFVLHGWYILTPFLEYVQPKGWAPGDLLKTVVRSHLQPRSFTYHVPGDLRRFERRAAVSGRP